MPPTGSGSSGSRKPWGQRPNASVYSSNLRAGLIRERGRLPLPKGEGWGEGLQTIERPEPPHPNPLPYGEREFRRAAFRVSALQPKCRHILGIEPLQVAAS